MSVILITKDHTLYIIESPRTSAEQDSVKVSCMSEASDSHEA